MQCLTVVGIKVIMEVYSVTYDDEELEKLREDYNAILEAETPQEIIRILKNSKLATHNYISTDSNLNSQIIIISPWQINKPMLFFIEEDNGKYYELLEESNDWLNLYE